MKNYLRNFWNDWRDRRHYKVHRQIKDRLFRFLFEKDRDALLQLYNALNGTNYQDPSILDSRKRDEDTTSLIAAIP